LPEDSFIIFTTSLILFSIKKNYRDMEETPKMGTTKIIEVIRQFFHVESNSFGDSPMLRNPHLVGGDWNHGIL
jgi:hypothetical protein